MANLNLRTIPNFSKYLISDSGEIYRTVKTTNGNIILQCKTLHRCYNGYVNVWLWSDDNKKVCMQVGRAVLLAFKPEQYFEGAECDHVNHNTEDNRVENLRWVSHSVNCKNRQYKGRQRDRALYLVFDDGSVQFYNWRKTTNIPCATLSKILSGKHSQKYKCIGFYWDELHAQSDRVKWLVTEFVVQNTIF